jgi:hypothetical protein
VKISSIRSADRMPANGKPGCDRKQSTIWRFAGSA